MSIKTIDKVLVANRGEIAARVMRTCRAMGIATVAVYSDADADAPFVRFADEAVRIGPPPVRESYLAIDRILAAARATGADAIHPGYGFLSENAAFAKAVGDAGLTFIGPGPMVIAMLGSKKDAKAAAHRAGVPVVPGYAGDDRDPDALVGHARKVGFPLLIKASAGGGGRGMRIVRETSNMHEAIDRARGEAANAFGDDTLILERYIERPRHVEVQILGDHHGKVVHLWERECSVQRRHQKVIEEAPSPALDMALRSSMGAAAVAIGRAVGYTNAGTVEFILAADGSFYFLEVNTRLQVEHPVTELTTGLDLVREQIRVARGEALDYDVAPPQRGNAIEVRLYAEDPANGYLPTTGTLLDVAWPEAPGIRVDAGVERGSQVSIHYDPMLAKVIAHGPTRRDAIHQLVWALDRAWLPGVVTNREHLARILRHPGFAAGEFDTHFLDEHAAALRAPPVSDDEALAAVIAATLAATASAVSDGPLSIVPPGWRNVPAADQEVAYRMGDRVLAVGYRELPGDRVVVRLAGRASVVRRIAASATSVTVEDERGVRRMHRVARDGARIWVDVAGRTVALVEEPRFVEPGAAHAHGELVAPMPGKVVKVLVAAGDTVDAGAILVVLEAMKMEHAVRAPAAGTVTELRVAVGDQVEADQPLAIVE
jgi:acetyl/propionyl-CoA carboxylase alpha subunit